MKFSSSKFWECFEERFSSVLKSAEDRVSEDAHHYRGENPEALYTSPEDYFHLFKDPLVKGDWVDLGCGMGLGPVMYASLYPNRASFGVDFSLSRILAGEEIRHELGLTNCQLTHADLATVSIPEGGTYFLYFPTGPVLDRMLTELYERRKKNFTLVVIESHGDLLERIRKEEWLEAVGEVGLRSPRHYPHAVVFSSRDLPRGPRTLVHQISFLDRAVLVGESTPWWAESRGLEADDKLITFQIPPRTAPVNVPLKVEDWGTLPALLMRMFLLRRLGVVSIMTPERTLTGEIRKIEQGETFCLEISSGEKVDWGGVLSISWRHHLCYESSSGFFSLPPAP